MGQLDGRVAAISGGSTGIGFGIARAFLAEGGRVAIHGRNAEKGKLALEELGAGDRAIHVSGDITVREDVDRFIDETAQAFGSLDILVNNAGGLAETAPVADLSDEAWEAAILWNLHSTFWASRRALRHMLPNGWGRIITISSLEGKQGAPGLSPYVASKHAVNGLMKALAKEVGPQGITANSICPGLVWTDVLEANGPEAAAAMGKTFEEMVDEFAQATALKRITKVEECAAVAVLLASEAGGGITGVAYSVDGGTAMW